MRFILFSLAFAAAVAFSLPASADPSTGDWLKFGSTTTTSSVGSNQSVVFSFPVGAVNSKLIHVNAKEADICFDADTGGTGGSGLATVKLALTPGGDDNAAITLPALVLTNLDCNPIVSGSYWVNIDTAASGVENPIVVIFGR